MFVMIQQNSFGLFPSKYSRTDTIEEAVGREERCEAEEIKNYTINYAQKVLVHIEETEAEINKIRKNAKDFKTSVDQNLNFLMTNWKK